MAVCAAFWTDLPIPEVIAAHRSTVQPASRDIFQAATINNSSQIAESVDAIRRIEHLLLDEASFRDDEIAVISSWRYDIAEKHDNSSIAKDQIIYYNRTHTTL